MLQMRKTSLIKAGATYSYHWFGSGGFSNLLTSLTTHDIRLYYSHPTHVSLSLRNPSVKLFEIANCILMGYVAALYVNISRRCDGT